MSDYAPITFRRSDKDICLTFNAEGGQVLEVYGEIDVKVDYDDVPHADAQKVASLVCVSPMLLKAVQDAENKTPAMLAALKEYETTVAWFHEVDPIEEDE